MVYIRGVMLHPGIARLTSIGNGQLRGTDCYEPTAPSKEALIYPLMWVAAGATLEQSCYHPSMATTGNRRELMQCTADVVHPNAKSTGAVLWAHSSLSRVPPGSERL